MVGLIQSQKVKFIHIFFVEIKRLLTIYIYFICKSFEKDKYYSTLLYY